MAGTQFTCFTGTEVQILTLSSSSGKPSSSLLDEIGEEVATREEGEFLGEMSLLSGVARTATVILRKK